MLVGNMGTDKGIEMSFWTKEEYLRFAEVMMEEPQAYYCFQTLYWCGIREGELLALTRNDFDLENKTLTINKSFQRIKKEDYITEPKTEKSNRIISLPDFLVKEMEDFFASLYKYDDKTGRFYWMDHCWTGMVNGFTANLRYLI